MKAIALVLAVNLACAPVLAQAQAAPAPAASTTSSDASPLSLTRVQRKLRAGAAAAPTVGPGLRIEEYINVYGKAVAIDVMGDFKVDGKAVQYGGMTHGEFLDLVTPAEFRRPTVDFLGLAVGAATWVAKKGIEKKKKAEKARIEEEAQRLRVQGVPPRK